jgi:hypothetical protein
MLIGLTGRARAGKDSAASVLVEEFGFKRYAFADKLKSMALALDPLIPDTVYEGLTGRLSTHVKVKGWDAAKLNPEVRRFLQVLGTEAVRDHLGENAWVQALEVQLEEENPERAVITDVRFPNEAEFIRTSPGFAELWKMERVNPDGTPYDNGVGDAHASEALIDTLSADVVVSASSLDQLHGSIRELTAEAISDWEEMFA